MSDPVREPHETDRYVRSPPFPEETGPDHAPEMMEVREDENRPPVLGVLLVFILVFWGAVAAFFLLRR